MSHSNLKTPTAQTELAIRRAEAADAATIARLGATTFAEAFGHLYPPEDLQAFLAQAHGLVRVEAMLRDPGRALWLAEAEGEAVAYALAGPCGLPHPEARAGGGEVKRLYIRKGWQGAGLGAELLAAAMAWLQRDGPRELWIGVWSQNFGAQRFYARHGFDKVGEYDFPVGRTVDREFILRRPAEGSGQG